MRIDTFNKHSHSDITSACKIFKSSDAANFSIILLVSFLCHRHFVILTLAVELVSNWYAGFEILFQSFVPEF